MLDFLRLESRGPLKLGKGKGIAPFRKKGRIVAVGDVGMELKRSLFYEKELDFLISRSYGPGRYDPSYEEKGIDYPVEYVRWTENRNMQAFLDLLRDKKIKVKPLIGKIFPLEEAKGAYNMLISGRKLYFGRELRRLLSVVEENEKIPSQR